MILRVTFPDNLTSEALLKQKHIPCLCRIADTFEVVFQTPFPDIVGEVLEWDIKEIDKRAPAGAGGKYIHYSPSLITLEKLGKNIYRITGLSLFDAYVGWCPVMEGNILAPPGLFWSQEIDDIGR